MGIAYCQDFPLLWKKDSFHKYSRFSWPFFICSAHEIQMILAASDTLNSYYRCQVTISMILHYAPISHKLM